MRYAWASQSGWNKKIFKNRNQKGDKQVIMTKILAILCQKKAERYTKSLVFPYVFHKIFPQAIHISPKLGYGILYKLKRNSACLCVTQVMRQTRMNALHNSVR